MADLQSEVQRPWDKRKGDRRCARSAQCTSRLSFPVPAVPELFSHFFLQEQYYLWMCYKERLQTMLCMIKRCPIIFSLAAQESLDKSMHMSVQVLH